jgi:Calcineurin-like phosphoesterase
LNADLTLEDETRVAVAGDWHANVGWAQRVIPRIARLAPDVRTVLHVGDFAVWPERQGKGFMAAVDYWMKTAGIERVLVTPGNHEFWSLLDARFAAQPDEAIRFSETVWVLPRGFRFRLAGRSFMSFGGAASVDYADRTPLRDWWPSEIPTEEHVAVATSGGPVDVLITHETVNGGTLEVERFLRANPQGWNSEELAYSAISRERVTRVWEAVQPRVLAHGHIHVQAEVDLPDGRRVYSLGCDNQAGNVAVLELASLHWTWLEDRRPSNR